MSVDPIAPNPNDTKREDLIYEISALKEENRELSQFSHILSHDLRAPLKNINNLAMMIALDPKSQLSERSKANIEKLQQQSQNLHQLIHDLREISKQNLNNLAMELVDPNVILERVLEQYQDELDDGAVTIVKDPMPDIFANPQLIWQLFDNAIRNALKHGARPLTITIYGAATPDMTTLTFKNDVSKNTHLDTNVFSFASSARSQNSSTGIGLFICDKIAKIHNGDIKAKVEDGQFVLEIRMKEIEDA